MGERAAKPNDSTGTYYTIILPLQQAFIMASGNQIWYKWPTNAVLYAERTLDIAYISVFGGNIVQVSK